MKFLVLYCLVAAAFAELPRYRPARFRLQRQELAPTTTDSPTEPTTEASGPYPPSGWRPSGEPFTLPGEQPAKQYGAPADPPAEQYGAPADQYGAPADQYAAPDAPYPPSGWQPQGQKFELSKPSPPATSYGVPDDTYGAPQNTYGAPDSTDAPTSDNPQAERLEGPVEVQKSIGSYFVLLPNGQLQKVEFATENDIQNMKYTARLQLRNPAPLFVLRP